MVLFSEQISRTSSFGFIVATSLVVLLAIFIIMSGCVSSAPQAGQQKIPASDQPIQKNTDTTIVPRTNQIVDDYSTKIEIARQIVTDYHKTHTYSMPDKYVCGDMSSDVWDMLKTRGIKAKIQVGNVDKSISSIEDADHAWVLAEVGDNTWVALETTGGYLVCSNKDYCSINNPLYFEGWSFDSPAAYKKMVDAMKHPCEEGYVLGKDDLCHPACGSGYCTGKSICINGECKGCDSGYIIGDDMKCHKACGSGQTYCSGDSICINGQCRGCDPGYILGDDMKCHQPCGSTSSYCSGESICVNGQCRGCDSGYYLGTDLRCHRA